jgi:hypothetical protein
MGRAHLGDSRRQAVLVGPLDTNPPNGEAADGTEKDSYVVLLHPAYHHGEEAVPFPAEKLPTWQNDIIETTGDDNYFDPVSARHATYAGRWLAGFAPVGNTGFTVVVQERYVDVVEATATSYWTYLELGLWIIAAGSLLVIFVGSGIWIMRRRLVRNRAVPA